MPLIVDCPSYDMNWLRGYGDNLWRDFPDVSGKRVFIKPNLVSPPTKWEAASCTHVNIVRMIIEKCQDGGAAFIRIGECGFKNQWEPTMRLSGYDQLPGEYGVEIVPLQDGPNFHKFTLQRFPNQDDYISLFGAKISDYVLDCDLVIDLPKLKVHSMSVMTGAIKNLMGVMANKGNMHPRGDHATLHKRLHDLYFLWREVIHPRVEFVLVDGVIGSEYAEQYGVPVNSHLLVAGNDPWSVDCISAQAMGISPARVPYLDLIRKSLDKPFPDPPHPDFVIEYELALAYRRL